MANKTIQSKSPIVLDESKILVQRKDQSSLFEDEVSIAQEFSRIESDYDVDERPTGQNSINKVKVTLASDSYAYMPNKFS